MISDSPYVHRRLQVMLEESNREKSQNAPGIVVLISSPDSDHNGAFSVPNFYHLLTEVGRTHRVAVVTLSKGAHFKQAIDIGKKCLGNLEVVHLMPCGHGNLKGMSFGPGEEGEYGIDQVRKEHFEGISHVFLNGCDLFELAKKITEEAGIPVCAARGKPNEYEAFYSGPDSTGSLYTGFIYLGKGNANYYTFYPDGTRVKPSFQIPQIFEEQGADELLSLYYAERDGELALRYGQKDLESPFIQYLLGLQALDQSKEKAISHFRRSALKGYHYSQEELAKIYFSQGHYELAVQWLKQVEKCSTEGKYLLAICYDRGWGVSQDEKKALSLIKSAKGMPDFLDKIFYLGKWFIDLGSRGTLGTAAQCFGEYISEMWERSQEEASQDPQFWKSIDRFIELSKCKIPEAPEELASRWDSLRKEVVGS